jgi:uncharacterized protein
MQKTKDSCPTSPLAPTSVGTSLKHIHYQEILDTKPDIDFFEVHSENYMSRGGTHLAWLRAIGDHYPLSLHGVGLSLGSAQPLDQEHLKALKILIERTAPVLVSEHLSWSIVDGIYLNDLLPIPYTQESLDLFSAHILEAQDFLGRSLLIENPSSYLYYPKNEYDEVTFLKELARRTGCGLLLDVNNIFVSAYNNNFSAQNYLDHLPQGVVGQIHLAGHNREHTYYIDDHGQAVQDEVWALYQSALEHLGPAPTLIEWDQDLPALGVLQQEAQKAKDLMTRRVPRAAVA